MPILECLIQSAEASIEPRHESWLLLQLVRLEFVLEITEQVGAVDPVVAAQELLKLLVHSPLQVPFD